ncbi:MAG: enoyl-CoA hydratase-related protein, partial [Actinomycetota bacterium]
IAGPQAAMATVIFGEILDGAEAERIGLAWKCVDDDQLLGAAHEMAARAASRPRELLKVTKRTIQDMAHVSEHPAAVERELDPQVWSTRQPWFAEMLAALQAKITKK